MTNPGQTLQSNWSRRKRSEGEGGGRGGPACRQDPRPSPGIPGIPAVDWTGWRASRSWGWSTTQVTVCQCGSQPLKLGTSFRDPWTGHHPELTAPSLGTAQLRPGETQEEEANSGEEPFIGTRQDGVSRRLILPASGWCPADSSWSFSLDRGGTWRRQLWRASVSQKTKGHWGRFDTMSGQTDVDHRLVGEMHRHSLRLAGHSAPRHWNE